MSTKSRWVASVLAVAGATLAASVGVPSARGQGSALGELGEGGTAQGDISLAAGEEDRIGIDLAQGATLTVKMTPKFAAAIDLLDPADAPTGASFGTAATKTLTAWTIPASGRYHFRIRSADGSQGTYTLTAAEKWSPKVNVTGQSGGSVSVGLPAGATVKGTITSMPSKTWDPAIMAFTSPGGGSLLASTVTGAKGIARLPTTKTTASGMHALTVQGGAAGGQFQAALSVKAPKVKAAKINIANGLTVVSFAQDGVAKMLQDRGCVACHTWATAAATAKQHAKAALPRVQTGQMPQGGPKLPAADISLLQQWILTGMNP